MRTFTIQQLDAAAPRRKPGHREAVLAVAGRSGDTLALTDADFDRIRREYRLPGRESKKATQKIRGLGDVVARLTKAVGFKPCAGCKQRQEKLNAMVPFTVDNPHQVGADNGEL